MARLDGEFFNCHWCISLCDYWCVGHLSTPRFNDTLVIQMLTVEKQDAVPHILSRDRIVAVPVIGEKSVSGIGIHTHLIRLAILVEFFFEAVGVFG